MAADPNKKKDYEEVDTSAAPAPGTPEFMQAQLDDMERRLTALQGRFDGQSVGNVRYEDRTIMFGKHGRLWLVDADGVRWDVTVDTAGTLVVTAV